MPLDQSLAGHTYFIYDHFIRSSWHLPDLLEMVHDFVDIELLSDETSFSSKEIETVSGSLDDTIRFHHTCLKDGSDLLRWTGLFEFLVSTDGRRIYGRSLTGDPSEEFQSYLLSQVLSFAMIRKGFEPLHATVIGKDGQAIAFLGDCGYGKSTIAGAFLRAGYQLLTDDMLIIRKDAGEFFACPGPPRIKLFMNMARVLISEDVTGTPIFPNAAKLIIPLAGKHIALTRMSIKKFYAIQAPSDHVQDVKICRLSPSQSLLAIVQNTFNTRIRGTERLARQFQMAVELSSNLPVKSLSYPRELSLLPTVVDAVLNDRE